MEVEGSSLDRISTLPRDITSQILSIVPIKDALRTSILSKKWRYGWARIPALKFYEKRSDGYNDPIKYKTANGIYNTLLLRSGPLVQFSLLFKLDKASEVDQIILHLSRNNSLKRFDLVNRSWMNYKLPSSFFSLQGLEHTEINSCHFDPPLTFNGFSRLWCLVLDSVEITTEVLKHFLTNCPLLKQFYLLGQYKCIIRGNKLTFVELLECLPSNIVCLGISWFYMKYFVAGGIPQKLPVPLVHLTFLVLDVCFMRKVEIFSTFCLIGNSPNLRKVYLRSILLQIPMDVVDLQDYSSFKFDHLQELKMLSFNNLANEMEVVKLVMAKSHVLKKLLIELTDNVSVDEEVRMLEDLIQLPLRASPSAKLLTERRKTSSYRR